MVAEPIHVMVADRIKQGLEAVQIILSMAWQRTLSMANFNMLDHTRQSYHIVLAVFDPFTPYS